MIKLIVGNKGSGKTKTLINMVNDAAKVSKGNVVCIEKELVLTFNIDSKVRLVSSDDYRIQGFDALYGFLTGMMAANYDITDIFVDATFKIGGKDIDQLAKFIARLADFCNDHDINITFTVSCDAAELPEELKSYIA